MCYILISESLTLTCTKAKLMVISNIIQSQFDPTSVVDIIQNSSLLVDAAKHAGNYHQIFKTKCLEASLFTRILKCFCAEVMNLHELLNNKGHVIPREMKVV